MAPAPVRVVTAPAPEADAGLPEQPAVPPPEPSAMSRTLSRQLAETEQGLKDRGLLRTDGGGEDTPYDARVLSENFVRIALYDEFVPVSGDLVARETASRLRRWEAPVRISLMFGDSVPEAQRTTDRAAVAALTGRLAEATRHDIAVAETGGNMAVFVVNEDERLALGDQLRAAVPGITPEVITAIRHMPGSTFCLMIALSSDSAPYVYRSAVAVVRAEHPPLLRKSCFHEEIAQGLGLANDSPEARPSIFNDDEEFALLTDQDELLLRMLYSPDLRPGMLVA
ncbi:MAG: DUF2927 domain-containing protein, partial [Mangrovicoccus sp.]|nr:DUF2927 domain-containing protein [Mangrovicoccus sp.]